MRAQAAAEKGHVSTEQPNEMPTIDSPSASNRSFARGSVSDRSSSRLRSGPRIGHLTGKRFGRYEIRRLVATGGMGVVYEARDTELNRIVALKIPRKDVTQDRTALARFVNEARAAAVIRHPHVCPIFDVGEVDGQQFLTMPLVEGVSLSAWLEQRTVSPGDAAEIIRKLASAVQAVHDAGIRHRDIKASNVMIDERGEPLLMDFGLARVPHNAAAFGSWSDPATLTHSGSLIGTPAYMAPEQIHEGATGGDERSDVYSLGVLLFQLLTGRLPFEGPITRVLVEIATREPPSVQSLRPDVDTDLVAICRKAMARDPAARFQSAAEFESALKVAESLRDSNVAGSLRAPNVANPVRASQPHTPQSSPQHSGHGVTGLLSAPDEVAAQPRLPKRNRTGLIALAAAFVILAGIVIHIATDNAELVIVAPDKGIEVVVRKVAESLRDSKVAGSLRDPSSGHGVPGLQLHTGENSVRVRSGEVEVVLTGTNADQYEVGDNRIVLKRGDRKVVEITRREKADKVAESLRDSTPAPNDRSRSDRTTLAESPWDQLDPKHIPPSERVPHQPEGLVAVLGEHQHRSWQHVFSAAVSFDGSQFVMPTHGGFYVWNRSDLSRPRFFSIPDSRNEATGAVFLRDGRIAMRFERHPGFHIGILPKGDGVVEWTNHLTSGDEDWDGRIESAAVSADGRWLSRISVTRGVDLWDVSQPEPKLVAKFEMPQPKLTNKDAERSFSPDSRWFSYVHASDLTVRIVDLQSSPPSEVAKLIAPADASADEPAKGFVASAFVSDGRLATCDGNRRVWLWNVGKEPTRSATSFTVDKLGMVEHPYLIAAPQSPVVVFYRNQTFQVWDLSDAEPKLRCHWPVPDAPNLKLDDISIGAIAVSPDGRTLLTGHDNGAMRFWDISGAQPVERLPLAPNPSTFLSGVDGFDYGPFVLDDLLLSTSELTQPNVWQIESGRLVSRPAPADGDKPIAELLAHSRDGRILAVRRHDGTGTGTVFRRHGPQFEPVHDILSDVNFHCAALNRNGSRLLIFDGNARLQLWDVEGNRSIRLAERAVAPQGFDQIAFVNDQRLVTRSGRRIQLWDIQPPKFVLKTELGEGYLQFALSPDGHTLVAGDKCWDLRIMRPTVISTSTNQELTNHRAVAVSPDGRTYAVSAWLPDKAAPAPSGRPPVARSLRDRNAEPQSDSATFGWGIDLIDVATGETKQCLAYPGPVRNIQFTPDGRHLVTANANSTIYVVRLAKPSLTAK